MGSARSRRTDRPSAFGLIALHPSLNLLFGDARAGVGVTAVGLGAALAATFGFVISARVAARRRVIAPRSIGVLAIC
jgi:hypothetical protein